MNQPTGIAGIESIVESVSDKLQDFSRAMEMYNHLCYRWEHDSGFKMTLMRSTAAKIVVEARGGFEDYTSFCCSGKEGKETKWVGKLFEKHGWRRE